MKSWKEITLPFLATEKGKKVKQFIIDRRREVTVYPDQKDVFRALRNDICPPDKVKLVILGNEPYHNGTADGLAFSCKNENRENMLDNIFKEIHSNLYSYMKHETFKESMLSNSLEKWAIQGVLLLNMALTVEKDKPGSHQNIGWEELTSQVVEHMGKQSRTPTAFMLWGDEARKLKPLIKGNHHLVLEANYPNAKEFLGCNHFAIAEEFFKTYLQDEMLKSIPFDMRKYLDLKGLIDGIKEFILKNNIPIKDPKSKLDYIFKDISNDYHWMMQYGIDYLT